MRKYRLLHERVAAQDTGLLCLEIAPAASDEQLLLAHSREYLRRVVEGGLNPRELRELGFPWSPGLVERSRRSVGATLAAAAAALEDGAGASLAGGTHHAQKDRAAGFCVFNDVAIAALWLLRERGLCQVVIVDCDVHQGDGTAAILSEEPGAYTFSIHGARNYPARKAVSDYDVALEDDTGDADYLAALDEALVRLAYEAAPDFVLYLAGADPYHEDRYGRLSVSREGLAQRDAAVCRFAKELDAPLVVVMGGGYAADVEAVADIHFNSVCAAAKLAGDMTMRKIG